MAPEQIRGEAADRRSDIFAFGILLYQLLSGTNPFLRTGVDATLAAILGEPVIDLHDRLPAIPPTVGGVVAQMLAKDPAARYQSFGDVRRDLRRLAVDLSRSAAPARQLSSTGRRRRQRELIGRDAECAQLASEHQSSCIGSRHAHRAGRRGRHWQDPTGGRGIGRCAAARLPDAGRPMLRTGRHTAPDSVHRSARGRLAADACIGVPAGDWPGRAGACETAARTASPLPGYAGAAGASAAAAPAIPVHECSRVSDTLQSFHPTASSSSTIFSGRTNQRCS